MESQVIITIRDKKKSCLLDKITKIMTTARGVTMNMSKFMAMAKTMIIAMKKTMIIWPGSMAMTMTMT